MGLLAAEGGEGGADGGGPLRPLPRSPTSSLCRDSPRFSGFSNPEPGPPFPPRLPPPPCRSPLACLYPPQCGAPSPPSPTLRSDFIDALSPPPLHPRTLRAQRIPRGRTHGCRRPRAGRWASAHSCPGTRRTWRPFPGPGCALGTASRGAAGRRPCRSLGDRLQAGAV